MTNSGWCQAAPGGRPKHEACRSTVCSCSCHENAHSMGVSVGATRYDGGLTKRPLGGASTPLVQGASPTDKESTDG